MIGQVALWGRVLRYTGGYRAQYAYPYALEVWDAALRGELAAGDVVGRLREEYVVDVVRRRPRLVRDGGALDWARA